MGKEFKENKGVGKRYDNMLYMSIKYKVEKKKKKSKRSVLLTQTQ